MSPTAAAATGLAEGTPVTGGTIDSWAEVAASGLRGPGEGLLVYGTSMFLVEVDSPARPDRRLWSTVGFTPGSLNISAGVGSAGALTTWLRGLTGDPSYDALYEEAAAAGPGAGGLLALPYFAGERTPLFDPDLRGALFGLTAAHGRGHVFRALLEVLGLRRTPESGDDARGRSDRRRSAEQRRGHGSPALAADRLRRGRTRAGRARECVRGGRRRGAPRGHLRRRSDSRDRMAADASAPSCRERSCDPCTTSSTGSSAS